MQVSIIGLGWLGLPLAGMLKANGYSIKGSTTSEEKKRNLEKNGYSVFKVLLTEGKVEGNIKACLEGSEVLILNTPPGLRRNPNGDYVAKIKKLIPFIENSSVNKVLFVGSTSVFKEEEIFPVITNETGPNSVSNSGRQLRSVEQLLSTNSHFNTTILRFAGLVDERRHPATMMSKRKEIPNPKAPVNLIHREDCVNIIKKIINQNKWNAVFNAAYPLHLEKSQYYNQICKSKGLANPDFNYKKPSLGKIIDGKGTAETLNYKYIHSVESD